MFIFNMTNPLTLLLMLIVTVLLIFLGQEIKKSAVVALQLFAYLVLIIIHVIQLSSIGSDNIELISVLSKCIAIDLVFILINFFAYLWVDDIETKATGKKSISNSLDWFWREI